MAVELAAETFQPAIGERFRATPTVAGEPFELVLARCDVFEPPAPGERAPFTLLFEADTPDHVPQQIVTLTNDGLGELGLFVVPLGPKEGRMRYEAVIN
jgi:hypothetical protein